MHRNSKAILISGAAVVLLLFFLLVIGIRASQFLYLYLSHRHIRGASHRPTQIATFLNSLPAEAEARYGRLLEPNELFLPDHTHLLTIGGYSTGVDEYPTEEAARQSVARISSDGTALKLSPFQTIVWFKREIELPPAIREVYLYRNFVIFYDGQDEQKKQLFVSLFGEPAASRGRESLKGD